VLPRRTEARDTPALRRTGSTVRSEAGGIRTRFSRGEVSEVFTTSELGRGGVSPPNSPFWRLASAGFGRRDAALPGSGREFRGPHDCGRKNINIRRGALRMARRRASPSWLAPPSVDRAIARAPFPPAGPALRAGVPKRHAGPGIRVSLELGCCRVRCSQIERRRRQQKTPPERPLGRGSQSANVSARSVGAAPMNRVHDRRRPLAAASPGNTETILRHHAGHSSDHLNAV
jgi:hypothetical protein